MAKNSENTTRRQGAVAVSAAESETPAQRAIAMFEANRALRATSWILPRVDPAAAASEPHAMAIGAVAAAGSDANQ